MLKLNFANKSSLMCEECGFEALLKNRYIIG